MNQNEFKNELAKINIVLTEIQIKQLELYYNLLIEYNKVMNLTGITEHDEVYLKHYYDSLTICKIIDINNVKTLCDIGTGAGFPGIVLKIVFPHLHITLVDSLNKRIKFLEEVIDKLKLEHIEVIHNRIEDYAKTNREKFDLVTARAVAPTNILLEYAIPLVKINSYFIAMKGTIEQEPNINNCIKLLDITLEESIDFLLPIENSHRLLLKFKKNKITKKQYPRNNKLIKYNPL